MRISDVKTQKWVDLWPPSFDFALLAQNGLNPSRSSPSCWKTLMIWPQKVLMRISQVKGKSESIFGLRHLILEFLPKMASTHLGLAPHAEKPWWFDLWMLKVGVNENFWCQNTKVSRSLASVIWFCTFGSKWPEPVHVQPLMLKNLDDLTSECWK